MQLFYREYLAGAQINFPESRRGLGHVTPTIFGSTVGYPSDSLASYSILPRDAITEYAVASCQSVCRSFVWAYITLRYCQNSKKYSRNSSDVILFHYESVL